MGRAPLVPLRGPRQIEGRTETAGRGAASRAQAPSLGRGLGQVGRGTTPRPPPPGGLELHWCATGRGEASDSDEAFDGKPTAIRQDRGK